MGVKVKYISATFDSSGYAQAARNNICALNRAGINISVGSVSFEQFRSDLGKSGDICKSLAAHNNEPVDIQIIHLTPQHFPQLRKNNIYNIGYTTWETDKLPEGWAEMMNSMDEIWVPSQYNIKVFKRSGVTKPIYCFPHTFDTNGMAAGELSTINMLDEDEFVFYSVFQWLERKDPIGLVVAYLSEFTSADKVALVLKTYVLDPSNAAEGSKIKSHIQDIKKSMWLKDYPKLLLITNLLSAGQIKSLHTRGDCYITLSRAEGFGVPIAEAMLEGKLVITTGYSGPVDFVEHEKTGYLVPYREIPVYGMPWDMYTSKMNWASADILEARKLMRKAYENREESKKIGLAAKEYISTHLSWDTIGNLMKARLRQIKESK